MKKSNYYYYYHKKAKFSYKYTWESEKSKKEFELVYIRLFFVLLLFFSDLSSFRFRPLFRIRNHRRVAYIINKQKKRRAKERAKASERASEREREHTQRRMTMRRGADIVFKRYLTLKSGRHQLVHLKLQQPTNKIWCVSASVCVRQRRTWPHWPWLIRNMFAIPVAH